MVNRQNMGMNTGMKINRQSPTPWYNCQQRQRAENVENVPDCGCNMGDDCKALMRRLQKVEFSLVDTVIYLDAYPECKKALDYYHKLLSERDALRQALSSKCKRPMSPFENGSDTEWDWIKSPWPWESSAN